MAAAVHDQGETTLTEEGKKRLKEDGENMQAYHGSDGLALMNIGRGQRRAAGNEDGDGTTSLELEMATKLSPFRAYEGLHTPETKMKERAHDGELRTEAKKGNSSPWKMSSDEDVGG